MPALPDPSAWRGRRVLVTGHTGFKGAWLALWLAELGAEVHGLGGPGLGAPGVYELAGVAEALAGEHIVDVRDLSAVAAALSATAPEVVLHLAAQANVRRSFADPATTWAVNVGGTVNVLQSLPDSVRAVLVVTSDKCYREVADGRRMREDDALGGTTRTAPPRRHRTSWRRRFAPAGSRSAVSPSRPHAPEMCWAGATAPPTAWCRTPSGLLAQARR